MKTFVFLSIILLFFLACNTLSVPERGQFQNEACWVCMQCLRMNEKNPDKSVCGRVCECCAKKLERE